MNTPVTPAAPGTPVGPTAPEVPAEQALDHDKLYAARLYAVRVRPYLATALFALRVVPSRRVPTMGVDRHWRMYVSPAFVDRTPMRELAGVWVHEVAHLLRDHHGRGDRVARDLGPADGEAERLRINIAGDFEINDDIYGDGLPRPAGALHPRMIRMDTGLLMEDYLRAVRIVPRTREMAWLDCGSGADGRARAWELGPEGADGLSPQEREAVVHRVAVVIDTSGSVSDTELGSALLETAALTRALGGRRDLVTVIACDAAAHTARRLCADADIPLVGGGGTDLRAGFARALRLTPRPDALVVFTDGQTPWPETAPSCRTVVGLFPRPPASDEDEEDEEPVPDGPPSWARVVEIG
ncbi:putative metal-dependent peptidase [Streptomyces filamentosus]